MPKEAKSNIISEMQNGMDNDQVNQARFSISNSFLIVYCMALTETILFHFFIWLSISIYISGEKGREDKMVGKISVGFFKNDKGLD